MTIRSIHWDDDAQHQHTLTHSLFNTYMQFQQHTALYLIQSHPIRHIWCFCYSWELSPNKQANVQPCTQPASQLTINIHPTCEREKELWVSERERIWKRRNLCGHTIHTSKKSYECWKRYKMNLIHIIQKWVLANIYVWWFCLCRRVKQLHQTT